MSLLDLIDKNGYNLKNLDKVNVILGKNGCGKSTALKKVEEYLVSEHSYGKTKYITPERGGSLKYNPNIEININNNPNWLSSQLRQNQFRDFKEQSVFQFRKLELLSLREIEKDQNLRQDFSFTFQNIINLINKLLDNVEIQREDSDFKIFSKVSGEQINPENISSGESELISLGIECLVFAKECIKDKENFLLLDEPDVHLHPDLQVRLALFIKELVDTSNFRVILATHSTSLLGAFENYPNISIEFLNAGEMNLSFKKVNEIYKKILPVFGAHPLSNIFNEAPILLVEGEDDVRIWQQAIRTSQGRIRIFPCEVGSITKLNEYEVEVSKIVNSIYDNATAFSLRDRDETDGEIIDISPVIRMKLSCRAAENLLLSNDVLNRLKITWGELISKIDTWIERNNDHQHYKYMLSFKNSNYPRKTFDLKEIRIDLMGIIGSNKPWEIPIGQAIGELKISDNYTENSLQDYLGAKLVNNILKNC
ncbi:AAA family ATPase [Nostoc spongiaeforme FACHB-130]|uniref:AAA family ATPase n=1 Tax=Nostoc spongiaeforme FACHB-130 TaxID=1357510 RepID=A0ABR8G4Y5_9NOSO|nr:AAA family ATPase [Nostoc spongiaeforme]MBD2598287.1 AAA family ATPase [Nostoc spongiaeforme FACHB-130]